MEKTARDLRPTLEELRYAVDEAVHAAETIEQLRAEGREVTEEEATLRFHLRTLGEALVALAAGAS